MTSPNNWAAARPGSSLGRPGSVIAPPDGFDDFTVAPGASRLIAGPATADRIRIYELSIVPATNVVGAGRVELRDTALATTLLFTLAALATTQYPYGLTPIGFGEVLRVVNTGAVALNVTAQYQEILNTHVTLLRVPLTDAAVDIIPPAPAGFANRFLLIGALFQGGSGLRLQMPQISITNRDTVAHTFLIEQGGVILGRTGATAANTQSTGNVRHTLTYPSGAPVTARTTVAITTTPPLLMGAYEKVPL